MRSILNWAAAAAIALLSVGAGVSFALEPNLQMPTQAGGQAFPALRPGSTVALGYGATTVSDSSAIGAEVVRVVCSTDCLISVGAIPTATVSSAFLLAKTAYFFRVVSGVDKVGAIQSATTGIIYITPMK